MPLYKIICLIYKNVYTWFVKYVIWYIMDNYNMYSYILVFIWYIFYINIYFGAYTTEVMYVQYIFQW